MSAEPELLDLASMPIDQLCAMVALLSQVQASARAIPDRPGHKAHVLRKRSLELADGLTPEIVRYNAEIMRRLFPAAPGVPYLRLVIDNTNRMPAQLGGDHG
jgi:hypothetical protein